ncbi:MAG: zinc-dependent metalloprotease [Rhodothermales bacterium]
MLRLVIFCVVFLFSSLSYTTLRAQDLPAIQDKTAGMDKKDGFVPIYWDAKAGKVWLAIHRFDEDFLYVSSLPAGLGSNDIGLDRGQLGSQQVVRFERVGPKVLMVAPNLDFRSSSDNVLERKAVEDAFAPSVVWGFTVAAASGDTVLVDATDFIVRDAHGVVQRLRGQNQGTFSLNKSRSAVYPQVLRAFPSNTEMEARLTFTGTSPGRYVRSVAANPNAITLRVRHSLIELPTLGSYTPRKMDPRSGYFGLTYVDYSTPIGERKEQQVIRRHRLECAGPRDADGLCIPVEPIQYYLDPGTPEPVRSALLEGGRWWNDAFTAAGFRNAFLLEVLPDSGDMMDVRYNTIQWVHRSTRGWSYGSSITDPRTGEILKGHVSLGSLRVRQDYLIAEGLLAPYADSLANGLDPASDPMLAMALARIRQLSAHEIGHTIGIAHNFAASFNDRSSVMDYPAPMATLEADADGQMRISLSSAYDTGIGEWDKVAVRYGYSAFPSSTNETEALNAILDEAQAAGLYYLTDSDARPQGSASPLAHLWDNGPTLMDGLAREMNVRKLALEQFGQNVIRAGQPLATMEEALVPIYLYHRYQVEAVSKAIGGVSYDYTLRGDTRMLPEPVNGDAQRAALAGLLGTLNADQLALPANLRQSIPPRPPGYGSTRELFDGYTGLAFDAYAPAEVVSHLVLGLILHPQRAARLAYQHDRAEDLPGLNDVLGQVWDSVWKPAKVENDYDAELQRIVQQVWTDTMLELAAQPKLAPAVRARINEHLRVQIEWLDENPGGRRDHETRAHRNHIYSTIDRWLYRPYQPTERTVEPTTPPGSPIGQDAPDFLHRQDARRAALHVWGDAHQMCTVEH